MDWVNSGTSLASTYIQQSSGIDPDQNGFVLWEGDLLDPDPGGKNCRNKTGSCFTVKT